MLSKKGFPQAISKTFSPVQTYLADNLALLKKVKRLDLWVVGSLALLAFIVFVPKLQVSEKITDADKAFQIENEARKTILQGLGGGFFFVTAYFAWRQVQVAEKNQEIAEKTRQASENKQVTERFVKAVEMLSDKELQVRLGGIYALERIAKDSSEDHWTVMEVLTSFIREKSTYVDGEASPEALQAVDKDTQVSRDIQAAITVIGRRDATKDNGRSLDLRKADLLGAELSEADLRLANLYRADLRSANLSGAKLGGAKLMRASLSGANLEQADLSKANLKAANLEQSYLTDANLSGTDLERANFRVASLAGCLLSNANLKRADLIEADLSEANLSEANLTWANLEKACLSSADLSKADLSSTNLSEALLIDANLSETKLIMTNFRTAKGLTIPELFRSALWGLAIYDLDFVEQLGLNKDEQTRKAQEWDMRYQSDRTTG